MLIAGVCSGIFGLLWSTTMQHRVPGHMLSRVSSYNVFGSLAFARLGLLIAGPAAAATPGNSGLGHLSRHGC
jgi:hypothetical protein